MFFVIVRKENVLLIVHCLMEQSRASQLQKKVDELTSKVNELDVIRSRQQKKISHLKEQVSGRARATGRDREHVELQDYDSSFFYNFVVYSKHDYLVMLL